MTKGKRNSLQRDRILALAEVIEEQPHVMGPSAGGFSMSAYFHPCGSPSCMAGFAAFFARDGLMTTEGISNDSAFGIATEYLGLDAYQAHTLFKPNTMALGIPWMAITPKRAANTLRNLAATGVVDWRIPALIAA